LKLDLLEVDEVFVVEFDVVRVQSVLDGVVKGVWRLRSSSGCGGSHEGLWNVGEMSLEFVRGGRFAVN
jgi:hypothetical protein